MKTTLQLLCLLLLSSCTPDSIDFNYPVNKDIPIVYGFVDLNGNIDVQVYEPISFNSDIKEMSNYPGLSITVGDASGKNVLLEEKEGLYNGFEADLTYPLSLSFDFKGKEISSVITEKVLPFYVADLVLEKDTIYDDYLINTQLTNPHPHPIWVTINKGIDSTSMRRDLIEIPSDTTIILDVYDYYEDPFVDGVFQTNFASYDSILHEMQEQEYKNVSDIGTPASKANYSVTNINGGYGLFSSRHLVTRKIYK